MCFDSNYILLSKISLASFLNISNSNVYIHFHIGLNLCKYSNVKTLLVVLIYALTLINFGFPLKQLNL